MTYNVALFIVVCASIAPLLIILLDYIIKSLYVLYWQNIFNNRISTLYNYLHLLNRGRGYITIRRKTLNGGYVMTLKSYMITNGKSYEYLITNSNVEVLGCKKNKNPIKLMIGDEFGIRTSTKLSSKLKELCEELIVDFNYSQRLLDIYSSNDVFSDLNFYPKSVKDIKRVAKELWSEISNKNPKSTSYYLYLKKCIIYFRRHNKEITRLNMRNILIAID